MNNYEYIKNMTLEEMADFLIQKYDADFGDGYCTATNCYSCKLTYACDKFKNNLIIWLQSEVIEQ